MTQLVLIRHGETEWNATGVFRGQIDVSLNETGLKQAELLGEALGRENIEAIYSSPLKRALVTAQAIARHSHREVMVAPVLTDLSFGDWQGLSSREVEDRYPDLWQKWHESPEQVRMPGGESLQDVLARVTLIVKDVLVRHRGTVVLVTHRVVNKVLICALLGVGNGHFWRIRMDTAAITRFILEDGRFILSSHNDISHLKPLGKAPLADF
ncbi:MAG: histidine phosphatase family protein [Chloroflexi bacterium]|nr:histidine phosphatase family protein [Chloroflexota bacterium]